MTRLPAKTNKNRFHSFAAKETVAEKAETLYGCCVLVTRELE
jgi:hypothetical protein